MSTEHNDTERMDDSLEAEIRHNYLSRQKSHRRAKITAGILVILYGTLFLLSEIGYKIDHWVFTPGSFMIAVALIVIAKHKFRAIFAYILLIVGKLLVLHEIFPEHIHLNYIWPVLIILFGLGLLFGRKKPGFKERNEHNRFRHRNQYWERQRQYMRGFSDLDDVSQDDFIDAVSIFGGVKKNVVSKQFRGADIVTIFGGNEINLSQADFSGQIVMDVTNILGGTTLTIPNDWQIKSEVVTILGGIEDKRPVGPTVNDETEKPKVILLRGTCLLGGIEINSFN